MQLRILKVDLTETEKQLRRIADALEGILGATDPIRPLYSLDQLPEENDRQRVFYSDDRQEIIDHHLRKLGKKREK